MMEELAVNGGKPVSERKILIAKPAFPEATIIGISEVLASGQLAQGPKVAEFEEAFKQRVGARYAYAVNSGTAALHLSYMSLLKPGDEAVIPDFTFMSTVSMAIFSGGRPVFADIDSETLTIDPEDVKEKLTPKTKLIVPVHLFGNGAEMQSLSEIAEDHGLCLVNDAAQAHGTRIAGRDVGAFDKLNCFSFYATKTMTTGEGGLVTTNDKDLYDKGRLIRHHGQPVQYHHTTLGFNYRMTEIAAVIGLNQLKMLEDFLAKRRRNAKILTEGLRKIQGLEPQKVGKEVDHSYSYYTVIMDPNQFNCDRDQFVEALTAENVESIVYYPIPPTKQPALKNFAKDARCPIAEEAAMKVFSVPVHPSLAQEDLDKILQALEKVASWYLK